MTLLEAAKQALDCWECEQTLSDAVLANLRTAVRLMEKAEPVKAVAVMVSGVGSTYMTPAEDYYIDPIPVPEGWRLVPEEPSASQLVYGADEDLRLFDQQMGADHYSAIYKAMLAAAPKPEDVK